MNKKDQLENRILNIAEEQLFQQGFRAMNVDEISKEVGISKRTLYETFENKETIATRVMETWIDEIHHGIDQTIAAHKDPVHQFRSVILYVSQRFAQMKQPFIKDLPRSQPQLWSKIESARVITAGKLQNVIANGVKHGRFKGNIHPQIAILSFFSAINGIVNPKVLSTSPFSAQEAIQNIFNMFFEGLLTEEAKQDLFEGKE